MTKAEEVGTALADDAEAKILGVCWKPTSDILTFRIATDDQLKFTRRGLLSLVAGIFDPLGLASPLVVKAKVSLKAVVIKGLGWDTEVTPEEKNWWSTWKKLIEQLNSVRFPRCLFPNEETITRTEMHTFSDASEEAFAAAVYLRNIHQDGRENQISYGENKGGTV